MLHGSQVQHGRWLRAGLLLAVLLSVLSLSADAGRRQDRQDVHPAQEGNLMTIPSPGAAPKSLIPPLDAATPAKMATATFALG